MQHRTSQSGFTLVEIAIVLVIIGLLLGGILKGQEMITNSKIKRINSDFKGISSAVFTYQDRYGSIPGDDAEANSHVGVAATVIGDGDGEIDNAWNSVTNTQESRMIWAHLRAAGIIAGSGFEQPRHAYGGRIGVEFSLYAIAGHVVCFEQISGDIAKIVDLQNDDGVPNTGSIQGHATQTTYAPATSYDLCYKM